MIPNFETLKWQLTFSLEMPKKNFDTNKYVAFYGTYAPESDPTDKRTVTCEMKLGDRTTA